MILGGRWRPSGCQNLPFGANIAAPGQIKEDVHLGLPFGAAIFAPNGRFRALPQTLPFGANIAASNGALEGTSSWFSQNLYICKLFGTRWGVEKCQNTYENHSKNNDSSRAAAPQGVLKSSK